MRVGMPRRTDRSVTDLAYKGYLESLETIVPVKEQTSLAPVIQVQNTVRHKKEEVKNNRRYQGCRIEMRRRQTAIRKR